MRFSPPSTDKPDSAVGETTDEHLWPLIEHTEKLSRSSSRDLCVFPVGPELARGILVSRESCICRLARVLGEDPHFDGAVVNTNSMAYVRRRPMTILYTNTFFALALLEELKLVDDRRG